MKNLAIIPARGGSKRIPRKNIKSFLGKPVLQYSIENALNTNLFEEIIVSTDDQEIAEISIKNGAKVPFMRSLINSNDFAPLGEVIIEVLEEYEKQNKYFDNVCCILPTAPLITEDDIVNAFKLLNEKNFSSVMAVGEYSYSIMRSLKINEEGLLRMNFPDFSMIRSQDIMQYYHDSGTFYWSKTKDFYLNRRFLSNYCGAYILDSVKVQDIDDFKDWELAELKYKIINHL